MRNKEIIANRKKPAYLLKLRMANGIEVPIKVVLGLAEVREEKRKLKLKKGEGYIIYRVAG